jgi:nucleotide-binding universal stress UspA family protein
MNKSLFHNILVAISGSQSSIHAAMYAILMAKTYHLELKVVYVVDTATTTQLALSKFFAADEREAFEANLTSDGNRYLAYVGDLAKTKGIQAELELRRGAIWTEIITAADDFKADFIVLGGRETDTAYHSERVVHQNTVSASRGEIVANSHCSLIIVRKPDIEQLFKVF